MWAVPMRILGITGGVACGKSTVTAMLGALGAPTLSADTLARDVLRPGAPATLATLAAFPQCAEMGAEDTVDRRALGRLVFANPDARALLESLTHPPIIQALRDSAAAWRAEAGSCAALEIPLLFEAGLHDLPDTIVVAACTPEQQLQRLLARPGMSRPLAQEQIAAQWPVEEKRRRAHSVVDTGGTLEETRAQVMALWRQWCA